MKIPDTEWLNSFFGANLHNFSSSIHLGKIIDIQKENSNTCFITRLYLCEEYDEKIGICQNISRVNIKSHVDTLHTFMTKLGSGGFTFFAPSTNSLDKFCFEIIMKKKVYEFSVFCQEGQQNRLKIELDGVIGVRNANLILYFEKVRLNKVRCFLKPEIHFIAHRGMGATALYNQQGYVENTVLSFQEAISKGAKWIEFDVQITKDGKVVVFHDFHITKDGKPHFVNNLFFSEFNEIYNNIFNRDKKSAVRLLTLEELMRVIDSSIGFNIEIKYPFLSDVEGMGDYCYEDPGSYAKKIVNIVLKSDKRNVFFSSFHPQIILAMKFMDLRYPIYFISSGGIETYHEAYCNSLWEAMLFSMITKINGIVLDIEALINNLGNKVFMIKQYGIQTMTYGNSTSNHDLVMHMAKLGINGFITDHINLFKTKMLQ